MSSAQTTNIKPYGRKVFIYFVIFFLLVITVNAIFITIALQTHTGVITKQAYEKGLKFDELIQSAKNQPDLLESIQFENPKLIWILKDKNEHPIMDASVKAYIIRSVQDGSDFEATFNHTNKGIYEAIIDLPYKGEWQVHLTASWNKQDYKTMHTIMMK